MKYGDVLPMVKIWIIWIICLQRKAGSNVVFYDIFITITSNEFVMVILLHSYLCLGVLNDEYIIIHN